MVRSTYKSIYCHKKVLAIAALFKLKEEKLGGVSSFRKKKIQKVRKLLENYTVKIYKKGSTIIRPFINKKVYIHDGLYFQAVTIVAKMVQFQLKFGQFVFTKRLGAFIHRDNKLAKKKAKLLRQIAAKASARKKKKTKKKIKT
jgi:ribosomal protein S19